MKVHLYLTDTGVPYFHAENPAVRELRVPSLGFRGWVERKAASLKQSWANADKGATGKARAVWIWMHRWIPIDEPTLIHLRTASSIEIEHPVAMSSEEAQSIWTAYLPRCRRRHLCWLIVNALLSPVSVLLAPVPGPNIIGYWFLYRAVRDLLALLGVRHAQDPRVPTTYHPAEIFEAYAGAGPDGAGEGSWDSEAGGVTFAALTATGTPP